MHKGQKASRNGIQYFLCPFTDMYIVQGSNGAYSHQGTMANDVRGKEIGVKYEYYAPCDVKLVWKYEKNGQCMWQSLEKVIFANGNIDYATFVTCHDNEKLRNVGDIVRQGENLGKMGDKSEAGNLTGVHCHIEIAQHKYDYSNWHKNKYDIYCFPDETDTDDCYFVNDTNILRGMGGNWKMLPALIKYQAHVQEDGWQDWKYNGEVAGTTGQKKRMEALRIDYPEVSAKAHIQEKGWVDYGMITKDTIIGTVGEKLRLECLCLKGNFKYRIHQQEIGWTSWTEADGICTLGSVGQSLRIEAIEIKELG